MPYLRVSQENTTDIELFHADHGSSRPVVLIHGYPLDGRSWEKQVPALVAAGRPPGRHLRPSWLRPVLPPDHGVRLRHARGGPRHPAAEPRPGRRRAGRPRHGQRRGGGLPRRRSTEHRRAARELARRRTGVRLRVRRDRADLDHRLPRRTAADRRSDADRARHGRLLPIEATGRLSRAMLPGAEYVEIDGAPDGLRGHTPRRSRRSCSTSWRRSGYPTAWRASRSAAREVMPSFGKIW
ncbi:hypothetical protein BCF44_110305 [Kutzneria buriramensis]|uniref:Alpha/beta hydrolase family protein n=1 Tax=Kutzneria buriramensis TaxID=1045776 RepID=A0A3E0HD82_9PSEU|nr:hypothetical protein BCF44_110305 [Kutzneria buriramensis]